MYKENREEIKITRNLCFICSHVSNKEIDAFKTFPIFLDKKFTHSLAFFFTSLHLK